ncbi:hypothetical protein GCM10028778_21230 [Barrientosiimonas marina]|uniref:AAA family ATPase n=1 Tax=Lentibacillus kimchii TaxID=1542911 RepID=A0ABW2UZM4_9BACI
MSFLQAYQNQGAQGLKQHSVIPEDQTKQDEMVNDLTSLTKEKVIKHDIEAQKVIVSRLCELGAYEQAEKLCKKLYIRKPNDPEIQSLYSDIKSKSTTTKSPFYKNKQILRGVEQDVYKMIYGQEDLIDSLSQLLQKSLLTSEFIYQYKEAALISSPKSRGVQTTLSVFFDTLYQYDLIDSNALQVIDLAQYNADENIVEMFFVDIYNAFMGKSKVTLFKNVDQCPIDLIAHLNSIVSEGRIYLDGRYIYQNGVLVKVNQMLAADSFDSIEATEQYLFFYTYNKLEKALDIFTESSRSKLTYTLTLPALEDKDVQSLFRSMMDDCIETIKTNLGITIQYDPDQFTGMINHYFDEGGAASLKAAVNQIYQALNQFFISAVNQVEDRTFELRYDNHQVMLKDEEETHILLAVKQTGENLQAIQERIEQLIGLQEVKTSLKDLQDYVVNRKKREAKGDQSEKLPLHFLFKGNPGTGKTMVARLIADYLKAIDFLSEDRLIEVDRSDLVGQYVGHTAVKTKQKINSAMGGVLFIDEAYSLANGDENDFGREAIATLVKAMEDYKDNLVVIFAGYPNEMDELLKVNPGLQSRITQTFYFSDYTNDELVQIALNHALSQGYLIDTEAREQLLSFFEQHQIKGKTDGGNGRLARQTVEYAIKKQAARLANTDVSEKEMDTLHLEDFGFEKEKPFDLEKQLNNIVGLDHIKDMVRTLYKQEIINQKRKQLNPDYKSDQALNFIFTGNPGTGKTSIARVLADLFKSINILKKGHLVEVSRSDLVAGHLGQTALKTEDVFMDALGGVLFIDEAYALADDHFGKEAINTLIKLIEDHQGDIVVILAGYQQHMNELLKVNPGISSRFTNTFHFPDYNANELFLIARQLFKSKGFALTDMGSQTLKKYIDGLSANMEGNGRDIRTMVEKIIRLQSNRLFEQSSIEEDGLLDVLPEDIIAYFASNDT